MIPIYASEKLTNKQIILSGENLTFYIEIGYESDEYFYVSDEIATNGIVSVELANKKLSINYYPRGNLIQIANESTHYPPIVRQIKNGDILAFRIDIKNIVKNAGLSMREINLIELRIIDSIFYSKRNLRQMYLTKDELYSKKYICSDCFFLKKEDYQLYWVD